MCDVIRSFRRHPEAKSAAYAGTLPGAEATGLLGRLDVRALWIEHIGKESNQIEEVIGGVCEGDPQAAFSEPRIRARQRKLLGRISLSELSKLSGVSERMLRDLRSGVREGTAQLWQSVVAALIEMLDTHAIELLR